MASHLTTLPSSEFRTDRLVDAKRRAGVTVSVVLPARDEEATVADIVRAIRSHLMDDVPLVDEIVVMDSFSTDATAERALAAGARVVACADVLPQLPALPGKGEALWRSLHVTHGDVVVFVDADLQDAGPHFVTGLLGPLLTSGHAFAKGFYRRPLITEAGVSPAGGGRVTELVARPLLNLYWPELAAFRQPLAGEYAIRRDVAEAIPFPIGYGVEMGMLIDLLGLVGIGAMAQVDLGRRTHSHQAMSALGVMSAEIVGTAMRRLGVGPSGRTLTQFDQLGGPDRTLPVPLVERPPAGALRSAVRAAAATGVPADLDAALDAALQAQLAAEVDAGLDAQLGAELDELGERP